MGFSLSITGYNLRLNMPLNDHTFASVRRGWRPRVAQKKRSMLGGGGVYDDVEESIPVRVTSSVAFGVLDYISDLAGALEQAQSWYLAADSSNELDPVLLSYTTEAGQGYRAVIVGGGDNKELLRLSPRFNKDLGAFEANITLKVRRRGLWMRTTTEAYKESYADDNPTPYRVTFTGLPPQFPTPNYPHYLPTILRWQKQDNTLTAGANGAKGYLIVNDDEDGIGMSGAVNITAESGTQTYPAMYFGGTSVYGVPSYNPVSTVAATGAWGGQLRAVTPSSDTDWLHIGCEYNESNRSRVKAIFLCLQNESSTITWEVKLFLGAAGYVVSNGYEGRTIKLAPGTGPVVLFVGMGVKPNLAPGNNAAIVRPSATGGGSDRLLVNYIAAVDVTEATRIISFDGFMASSDAGFEREYVHMHPRTINAVNPIFFESNNDDGTGLFNNSARKLNISYRGVPYPLSKGGSLSTAFLGINNGVAGSWRIGSVLADPIAFKLRATREIGFLTPRD